jgi:hypothetical protein
MNRFLFAAAAFALSTSFAFADDIMASRYGNTTVATGGMAETHSVYDPDHTFVMKAPAFGLEFKGTWAIQGANLCRIFEAPPPGVTNPLCTPAEAHKVGDSWTVTNGDETRTVTLVQGLQ